MIGQTISQYKILEKLGEGGMGVVYKAQDTKLDRFVALKFLPAHLHLHEAEQARFLQEARAASAINHPNVCTIYDIKEEQGVEFIVMEYIDGETLRKKVPLNVDDALRYAVQIGDALHEAHSKGIVHRDIKCENIMVNGKNQIKVMDFGLAKLKGSLKLTRTSSTVGTLAYMAPEQIQGGDVDARSDIFSFGVVLFEMLTGKTPFRGEHDAAIIYSIVNEEPESLLKLKPELSPELERIIDRALEKDPEDRYQSVADLTSELKRVQKKSTRVVRPAVEMSGVRPSVLGASSAIPVESGSGRASRKRGIVIGGAAIIIIAGAIAAYLLLSGGHQAIDSLAVLPFQNVGADSSAEYLSDGITESLINTLSQLSNLAVKSRSSVFHYKGKDVDPQKAGKELGVKAVLTGSVTQRGDNLQISAELVDVANDNHLWGNQYNTKLADLLSVQETISKQISQNLSLKLAGDDEKKLEKQATQNTEAYELYLKGRFYWNKRNADDLLKAMDFFNQAIAKDPNYALAYAGLASTYEIYPEYSGTPMIEYSAKAIAAADKAMELDPTLAEPHAVLGSNKCEYQWDWAGAETEFRRAIELDPGYPTAHFWYALCLEYQGKFDTSLVDRKSTRALDPLSIVINQNFGEILFASGREDEAVRQLQYTVELDPNLPGVH